MVYVLINLKVDAIQDLPQPITLFAIRSFHLLVSFYRGFIPYLSTYGTNTVT